MAESEGVPRRLGFYTTVFVEAFDSPDAGRRALELLLSDQKLQKMMLNADDDPMSLSPEEIQETDEFNAGAPARTGLALYEEKEP